MICCVHVLHAIHKTMDSYLLVISYAVLGAGIKYIDQAYDIDVFDKKIAKLIAVPLGILMGYLIVTDAPSATIFLAMVIGLALTQKLDNIAFYIGTALFFLLPIIFHDTLKMDWLPFGVLLFAGILDELGNDWADRRAMKRMVKHVQDNKKNGTEKKFRYKLGEKFFLNRFMMKIGVLGLVLSNYLVWIYFIAFMAFDISYTIVDYYSMHLKEYSIKGNGKKKKKAKN